MSGKKQNKLNLIVLFLVVFTGVVVIGGIALTSLYFYQNRSGEEPFTKEEQGEIETIVLENLPNNEKIVEKEVIYQGKYGEVLANPEKMKEENIYTKEGSEENKAILAFAGDVMFDDSYSIMTSYRNQGGNIANNIDAETLGEMHKADIFMLNNECTFTTRGEPIPDKQYTFRAKPENANILKDMGVDIVSLANNHAYDYGEISLLDTLDAVDAAGIQQVGAGRNLEEARSPVYYIVNDIKIAIVSATQIERLNNPDTKGATDKSAGVFRCFDPEALSETIKEAKANSDFVVVYLHWGTENTTEIDWAQRDHSKLYVEAGADLIIGDHPHCLQGITYIEDTPIIYSVGNFWFNSKTIDTGIVKVTFDKNGIENYRFIPCLQTSCTVKMLEGAEKDRVLQHMRDLSPGVTIDADGNVTKS